MLESAGLDEGHLLDTLVLSQLAALRATPLLLVSSTSRVGGGGTAPRGVLPSLPQPPPLAVIPDAILRVLEMAFAGDDVLDRGLEALDNGAVTRVECPAGRVLWTVASSMPRSVALEQREASGVRDGGYTVVSGFCTCREYCKRVLLAAAGVGDSSGGALGGEARTAEGCGREACWRRWCKHTLAVALAEALGPTRFRKKVVTDEEAARMMGGM